MTGKIMNIYVKQKDYQHPCEIPLIAAKELFGLPSYPDGGGTIKLMDAHTCPFWIEECGRKSHEFSIRVRTKSFSKTLYFKRVQ